MPPVTTYISADAIARRQRWVAEVRRLSGNFGNDTARLLEELNAECLNSPEIIKQHLRLCGAIPEGYGHDSSEEKLYSKYTDAVVAEAFASLAFRSVVLEERADSADVSCRSAAYSFVADAKVFRLSRTAKNAKDFKVQSMDAWRGAHTFAMVVSPLYQLPSRRSQIYSEAITRNVCVFSFSHVSVLVGVATSRGADFARELLHQILRSVATLLPTQDAQSYWAFVNRTILESGNTAADLWLAEKLAAAEALEFAKAEAREFLARERDRILGMSHQEALQSLLRMQRIESRLAVIESVSDNLIMELV